ncbi:pentapeptide repeat-containing protein [Phenylobacterium sp.]|uniref:pentapeptide repeat-containing protein n=1 Tax=Phenylobacterium sp. TaxID=1871053 RepID=UPI002F40139F
MSEEAPARIVADQALARADVAALAREPGPVHLAGVGLEETDLSGLVMAGWTFERCQLRHTRLVDARLEGSRWIACRAGFADFSGADLAESEFRSGDFNNASFRRCALAGASFVGGKLTGADFSDVRALGAAFEEVLLVAAKLPGFSFRKAHLKKLDFSQADLRRADFRDAILEDTSLRGANLVDARFQGADLRGADLGGLRLVDAAPFRGATISGKQAGQLLAELGLVVR